VRRFCHSGVRIPVTRFCTNPAPCIDRCDQCRRVGNGLRGGFSLFRRSIGFRWVVPTPLRGGEAAAAMCVGRRLCLHSGGSVQPYALGAEAGVRTALLLSGMPRIGRIRRVGRLQMPTDDRSVPIGDARADLPCRNADVRTIADALAPMDAVLRTQKASSRHGRHLTLKSTCPHWR